MTHHKPEERSAAPAPEPAPEKIDILEHGRAEDGRPITSSRRLFMQLLAWGRCSDTTPLIEALEREHIQGTLYEDVNDPTGVALLTMSMDPEYFVTAIRGFLKRPPFSDLAAKPEFTMLGRTYALGYEPDLDEALIERPRGRVLNPDYPWAIWYPLRRSGSFERLSAQEQRVILMEHGGVGHAYGKAGYGFDIRLACHGLDKNDNDFVIGLIGPALYPLSSIVQRMRKTKQTSLHLERLGPFFVGRVVWQAEGGDR
jgi:hypothetical protein